MRKTAVLPVVFLSVIAAAVVAGCSNNNIAAPGGTPSPNPSPSVACTVPPGYSVQEVFPTNGNADAANLQGVVIAVAPSPLPTNWYIYGVSSYGTTYPTSVGMLVTPAPISSANPTPSPLPTPSDTPAFANPIYESASIGIFATSTRFTIYLANPNCYPGVAESSFTTSATDSPPTPTPSPAST